MRVPVQLALFLALLATAYAHGGEETTNMDMNMDMGTHMEMGSEASTSTAQAMATETQAAGPMSYFAYGKHSSTIVAHIAIMVIAWCLILPAGTRSSPELL